LRRKPAGAALRILSNPPCSIARPGGAPRRGQAPPQKNSAAAVAAPRYAMCASSARLFSLPIFSQKQNRHLSPLIQAGGG